MLTCTWIWRKAACLLEGMRQLYPADKDQQKIKSTWRGHIDTNYAFLLQVSLLTIKVLVITMHVRQQAEMPFLTDRELCASIAGIVGLPRGPGAEAAWVEAAVKTREICRPKRLNRPKIPFSVLPQPSIFVSEYVWAGPINYGLGLGGIPWIPTVTTEVCLALAP